MVAEAATLLVPASTMPVTSEIWRISRDYDEMTDADVDDSLTARARIGLACLIRLYGMHRVIIEHTLEF